MGVYERDDSPFWWLWIEPTGQRISSKIPKGRGYQRKDSKAKAEDIYRALMGDHARGKHGLPIDRPVRTFREQAEWYRDTIAKHHKGARRAVSIVNQLIKHFGDERLTTIDEARIEDWKAARAGEVSKETTNRELDTLKPLLRSAVPKYLERSPADSVKRFRVRRFAPITILTHDAEDKLLAVADAEERAFILLGIDALLRQSDVRTFRVEQNHGTFLEIPDPKTGMPYKVPASTRLQAALQQVTPKDGWYFARRYRRQGPKHGTWQPITESTAWKLFRDLCVRAKVPHGKKQHGVTYHGTRHTGATRAMKATTATAVMKLGGWSSLKQLVRYDHPDHPDLIRGVEAIGSRPTHAPPPIPRKQARKPRRK